MIISICSPKIEVLRGKHCNLFLGFCETCTIHILYCFMLSENREIMFEHSYCSHSVEALVFHACLVYLISGNLTVE